MYISRKFQFDAAHHLPGYNGKCSEVHGHTYSFKLDIYGKVKDGMVMDFKDLSDIVKTNVIDELDHSNLNDIIDYPTAENIVVWIWDKLNSKLNLDQIELWETENCSVIYDGKD